MKMRHVALIAAAMLALGSCSGGEEKTGPRLGESHEIDLINPLTGLVMDGAVPENPVFVVKIDNTAPSAPQTSIDRADMVVEQTVEGGVTRLAVFYWTDLPTSLGHVRSTRATDIGIAQPANAHIVASGGADGTIHRITNAGISLHTEDDRAPGFSSDIGFRPYNRLLDLTAIAAGVSGPGPNKPYFEWAAKNAKASESTDNGTDSATETPAESATANEVTVRFSGMHTTSWALKNKKWLRTNGTATPEFAATNLIVIHAQEKDAGYLDPAGYPVPETLFKGEGEFTLFHGGEVTEGTWSKSKLNSTIVLKDKTGAELKMPAGRTWIELVNQGQGKVSWK